MKLDYSSLASAVSQLQKSLDYLHSDLARKDADLREQFRAATIQAFEFSYELAVKMIRRQLALIVANPDELREIDFADLMRDAADAGIVRDVPPICSIGRCGTERLTPTTRSGRRRLLPRWTNSCVTCVSF